MYKVSCYRRESMTLELLTLVCFAKSAADAIRCAYAHVLMGRGHTLAHIVKDHTETGLYVARYSDMRHLTLQFAVDQLKAIEWDEQP